MLYEQVQAGEIPDSRLLVSEAHFEDVSRSMRVLGFEGGS